MRPRFLYVVIWVVTVCRTGYCGDSLWVVRDGDPTATVVVADNAGGYQKWAAQKLLEYVRSASGAALPMVKEGQSPVGALISVGHTKLARRAGIATDDLKYDGCRMVAKGNVLYLIGRDAGTRFDRRPNVTRGAAQGTIRAVAIFLEEIVGVRWFLPGREGTVIPSVRDISVPARLSKTFVPAMAYCSGRSPYVRPMANYANNLRTAVKYLARGGHSWEVHVSDREYFKDHPKYFALLSSGTRSRALYSETGRLVRNCHLCTSNPDVRRIMVEKIRAEFDQGYDIVQLGQSDGWQPCVCGECMKMDDRRAYATITREQPCEKIWLMHKWILDELMKTHPHKMVNVMVYGPTKWPSKRFDSLPDNAVTEMAPITDERLEAWRGKIKNLTTYLYWWEDNCNATGFVPSPSPEWLQKTLRRYRDLGVIGIKGKPRVNWGLGGPTFYAYGKLMGDPDTDIGKLLHEYCLGVYGEAGPTMKRFFKLFHSRSSRTRELPRFPHSYPAEDAFTALYPARIVRELDRLLGEAESAAETERARGWVRHTRDCFDGLRTVAEMFAAKRFFELEPTRERLLGVKCRVEAFEQWRARILALEKAHTDRWFPGYWAMAAHLMTGGSNAAFSRYYYGYPLVWQDLGAVRKGEKVVRGTGIGGNLSHNEIGPPITWDFDRILANLGKPKRERIIGAVRAERPPVLDGRLAPEWSGAEAQGLELHQSEGSKIPEGAVTEVRLMYDDQALYVAYECVEPRIGELVLKSVGRDGDVWHCDEVELLLNPDEHSTRKAMHFMAAPIENAFYDERKGFITDPVHPEYGNWETASWNPVWRYAGHVDQRAKKWWIEMAIPFESLGLTPPVPGTVWRGNFARCRRAGGAEDLSSWVPETFGAEPEYFGKIVFLGPGRRTPDAQAATQKKRPAKPKKGGEPPKNCVRNGSFEVLLGRLPTAWSISSYPQSGVHDLLKHCRVTTENVHRGERSLEIDFSDLEVEKIGNANNVLLIQHARAPDVQALRGKDVVFSLWVCYKNLPRAPVSHYLPGPWFDISVGLGKKTQSLGKFVLSRAELASLGYVTDAHVLGKWIKIEKKLTVPAKVEWLRIRGGLVAWDSRDPKRTPNRTSLRIDDVCLAVAEM